MIDVRCLLGFHDIPDQDDGTPQVRCQRCGRFVGWWDNFRSGLVLGLAGSLLILAVMALAGCSCGVRNSTGGGTGGSTVAAELARFGRWSLWAGGIVMGLGMALRIGRIASFAATIAAPFLALVGVTAAANVIAGIASTVTAIGGIALAIGIASLWASDHPWLVPVAGGAAALAFGFRHRRSLRRWFRLGADPVRKEQVTP